MEQQTPEPWEAAPQPDGSWILKTPTRYHNCGNIRAAERSVIVAHVFREPDLLRIAEAVNMHANLLLALQVHSGIRSATGLTAREQRRIGAALQFAREHAP